MEKLNPWKIEVRRTLRERLLIDVVHEETGEIRQIELGVNDLNNIMIIGTKRIETTAEILCDDSNNTSNLEKIIGENEES